MILNRKKAELTIETIIIIILALIILVVLLFFTFNPYISDWIKNLPGYKYNDTDTLITNFSKDELANMGCSLVIARIGALEGDWTGREQYFYIEGKKSDLYFDNDKIFLDVSGSDIEIGMIGTDGKLMIYGPYVDEKSNEFLLYKEKGLPRIEVMKLLQGSYKLSAGNYICKTDQSIKDTKQCSQECGIFGGICKTGDCLQGEVSYGQINCKASEKCCVSESFSKLENNGLIINAFGTIENDFTKENKIEVVYGKEGLKVIRLDAKFKDSFCYVLRTNENVLKKSFDDVLKNDDDIGSMPVSWIVQGNEKTLELRVWNPNDKNNSAGRRLIIEGKSLPENYEQGEMINDNEIKVKTEGASVGSVFYVLGLRFDWSKQGGSTYSSADYKIKKTKSGEVEIYVYGVYPAKENEWHLLDCYTGLGSAIYITNLKQSLTESMVNSCGW